MTYFRIFGDKKPIMHHVHLLKPGKIVKYIVSCSDKYLIKFMALLTDYGKSSTIGRETTMLAKGGK